MHMCRLGWSLTIVTMKEDFLIKEERLLIMLFGPSLSLREGMAGWPQAVIRPEL